MARQAIPEASRRRLDAALELLRGRLDGYWKVAATGRRADTATVRFEGPRDSFELSALVASRVEPRDLDRLLTTDPPSLLIAPWLSPRTRELLSAGSTNYIDLTGNIDVRQPQVGFVVIDVGAQRDPNPPVRKGPNVTGSKAWALLRTMAEVQPPYTAGDLAAALDLDDGYVSRVLQVLVDERLIDRQPRRAVTSVDWLALLRRITEGYSLMDSNRTTTWIATAGPAALLTDLATLRAGRWALTGSFVASSIVPTAAPEMVVLYTDDAERLAKVARLLPATTGANVILAQPYNPIVFTRQRDINGASAVSLAQAAMDLLTGPARMPAEGEALLSWMGRNQIRWQSTDLQA